ncbi:DUF4150 domain-containing protein [Vibrio mexicanus]|uniref:DUF4150 domain-containing protein n=1 Tax=Vibrio mexicanus TaxID=1004326 RepID=UPI000699A89B|nr:DUF4150 domain-containing protein [Vibrio mexicanus]
MPVTINANDLSIVHQGSDGEANASVPDVCLTKVGKPIVPIPYGNNAKSADLVDGTTTVTADGGNSIALEGSKFASSTGDEGGDHKGVASGTIADEAEFVTSSPTVIIEGKGVARQSDHMTMNKANTMCFGVENPSVIVEEDVEPTYTLNISARYPNGKRLTNAEFQITDKGNAALSSGTLGGSGQGVADGLKSGIVKIKVEESADPFEVTPTLRSNPRYVEDECEEDFFVLACKAQTPFWKPVRVETSLTPWGRLDKTSLTTAFSKKL